MFTPLLSTITYVLNFSLKPARVTSSSALRKIRKGEDVGRIRETMMKQTVNSLLFFLGSRATRGAGCEAARSKLGGKSTEAQPILSPHFHHLTCIILLFRSPCVAEERRATAGGLMMKETYVVLTCYKAQHPGPIAHQAICAVYVDRHIWFHSSSNRDCSTPVMRTYMFRFRYLTLDTRKTGRSFILSYHTLALV